MAEKIKAARQAMYDHGGNWMTLGFLWGALIFSLPFPWWAIVSIQAPILVGAHFLLRWSARKRVAKWFTSDSESSAS